MNCQYCGDGKHPIFGIYDSEEKKVEDFCPACGEIFKVEPEKPLCNNCKSETGIFDFMGMKVECSFCKGGRR